MSDFVESVFETAGDIVGGVVETAGEVVGSVAETIADNPELALIAGAVALGPGAGLFAAEAGAGAIVAEAGLVAAAESQYIAALALAEGAVPYATVGLVEGASALSLATDTASVLSSAGYTVAAEAEALAAVGLSADAAAISAVAAQESALIAANATYTAPSAFSAQKALGILDTAFNVGTKALTLQTLLNPTTGKKLELPKGATIPIGYMPTGQARTVFAADNSAPASGVDRQTLMPDDGGTSRLWLYAALAAGTVLILWSIDDAR